MEPTAIAAQLREIAVYFELDGDRHRAIAYQRAAGSIEAAKGLDRLIDEGRLEELPHIGPKIALVVGDLARRGSATVLEKLRAKWPAVIVELAQLPYVGVQKARKIYEAFRPGGRLASIDDTGALSPPDLDAVAAAARAGVLRELPGFGKVSEAKVLAAIEERRRHGVRAIHVDAEEHALSLAAYLRAEPAASRVEIAGPVRRWLEIVDHLAFAVASEQPDAIAARLADYALVTSAERSPRVNDPLGPPSEAAREAVLVARLADGMRCEVHVAPPARFGWALLEATGSPEHVAQLRARGAPADAADESDVYRALGVPFCPPEVRDGSDELGTDFSDLVTLEDVTCAFHCHTTYSDGKDSIEAMALAARELGMRAITITDHSAAASYAGGIGADGLRAQAAEIAGLPELGMKILRGTEADILADGAIDVPPEMISELDLVIASVHQRYKLDEAAMTARLVAAMRQPFFKVWGHALGRLVLRRDPIAVRLDDVLDAAAESRVAIELNGDPYRLDLAPEHARRAAARGIPFVLSSDAHSTRGIAAVRWAVALARRARLRKAQILNALPPDELCARIRPRA